MKREEILFYMMQDKIYIYLANKKQEKKIEYDTSLFFEFGEIKDVEKCESAISKILSKINLGPVYLKPNIFILYNDICHSDTEFLYKYVFRNIGYNEIKFIKLHDIVKKIRDDKNIIIYDGGYYTYIDRGEKDSMLNVVEPDPILIGIHDKKYTHYSDVDIIWNTYKTSFTNSKICDKIVIGDGE